MKSDYDKLKDKVERLERENAALKEKEGTLDNLISFYSQLTDEYTKLNRGLRQSKHAYDKARQEILLLKSKYKNDVYALIEDIKKT